MTLRRAIRWPVIGRRLAAQLGTRPGTRDGDRPRARPLRERSGAAAVAAVVALAAAACSFGGTAKGPQTTSHSSAPHPATTTDAPHSSPAPTTVTIVEQPSTIVTTPTDATPIVPPPTTEEPPAVPGTCPYLTDAQVADANGQRTGTTSVIATMPYPVCVFTRSSGGFLAAVRIVVAQTPQAAAAAVNEHVPIGESFPAAHPTGWTGGAMTTPNGVPGYPDAGSIYAVSKGPIAIIAISNQRQSIKGRQMVADIVANLKL